MTDKAQSSHSPGYDFFGSAAPPPTVPPAPQPSVADPVNQFGTPLSAAGNYGPPATMMHPPTVSSGRSGMTTATKVVIGVACGVAGLLVIGILAAIVIPVFLNQRAKAQAAATTLSLPATIGSRTQLTDSSSTAFAANLAAALPSGSQVTVYGAPGDPSLILYVYPKFLPGPAQSAFLAGIAQDAQSEGLPMHQVDSGALGGQGRCGAVDQTTGGTHCVFVDAAGAVGVIVRGTGAAGELEAVAIREQVEHRSS